jgi:uncharacterized phage protein gp47/JayE
MADLADFVPIRVETLDTIIARIDADLNAGVDPEDDAFIDTTPGGFYSDIRTAFALEIERLWDVATTDTVAASLVDYAWGAYLDAHGETLSLTRQGAVAATGEVTFVGTNGTLIAVGTEVSNTQTDPEEEPVSFVTTEGTEDGGISGGSVTLAVEAAEAGAASNLPSSAVNLLLSPVSGVSAVTNASAITGGADVETDDAFRQRIKLAWAAAQGSGSVADYQRWALAYPGIGFVRVTPIWNGAGTVRVVVTDTENNPVSTAVVNGLQDQLDPYDAETKTSGSHSSPSTLTVDDTTGFATTGRIYVGDQLGSYTGKTSTTFTGVTGLSGSIADDTKVVQHGSGNGLAPVGAIVTVKTASTVIIDVECDIELSTGYSLDGSGGTIGVEQEVTEILGDYINNLPPGGEKAPGTDTGAGSIVRNRIASLLLRVPGVYDVDLSTLEIEGAATDYALSALQVPELGTVTLTAL